MAGTGCGRLKVFVSSTTEDLKAHRLAVFAALQRLSAQVEAMEDFNAAPGTPVSECRRRVVEADALVVIVAHRYGSVPGREQGGHDGRSFTWLEVEAAEAAGRAVFAFLVDPEAVWKPKKEQDRLVEARDPQTAGEIVAAVQNLVAFREHLRSHHICVSFVDPDGLGGKVVTALLDEVRERRPAGAERPLDPPDLLPPDLDGYLDHVESRWGVVILTGLLAEKGAAAIPLDEVYVSLDATRPAAAAQRGRGARGGGRAIDPLGDQRVAAVQELFEALRQRERASGKDRRGPSKRQLALLGKALVSVGVPIETAGDPAVRASVWARIRERRPKSEEALAELLRRQSIEEAVHGVQHLLIEGDPGSGKTTLLMWVALALVRAWRGAPDGHAAQLGFAEPWPLPLMVPLRRFGQWLQGQADLPQECAGADTLRAYLEASVAQFAGGSAWLAPALEAGRVAVLLDGLDEVVEEHQRRTTADVVRDFVRRYSRCRFLLTSRPTGLSPDVRRLLVERGGLAQASVCPLDDAQIERFVRAWYRALVRDPADAERRAGELLARIGQSAELTTLARTPITLTAIAVAHQTGPLPERRAELYHHCVQAMCGRWDSSKDPAQKTGLCGRIGLDGRVALLQGLAIRMYERGEDGLRVELGPLLDFVAAQLAEPNRGAVSPSDCREAVQGLVERTGLLVPDGERAYRFRHKQFLEFLAARWVGACAEDRVGYLAPRLADAFWREVVVLVPSFKAIQAPADARKLVDGLAAYAQAELRDPAERALAFAALARAVTDLAEYHVDGLAASVARVVPDWVALLESPEQPGTVADRIAMGEVLGRFGDPRLGADVPVVLPIPGVEGVSLGKYPVTVAEYGRFVDNEGYANRTFWDGDGWRHRGQEAWTEPAWWDAQKAHPNRPVVGVTWFEACGFCRWLSSRRPGEQWRLPSEAEWQAAATRPAGEYPWGEPEPDDRRANFGRTVGSATPVGLYPSGAGPGGHLDLAGNVWEWCRDDVTAEFQAETKKMDIFSEEELLALRALRGGGFRSGPGNLRSPDRDGGPALYRSDGLGFRVAVVPASTVGP